MQPTEKDKVLIGLLDEHMALLNCYGWNSKEAEHFRHVYSDYLEFSELARTQKVMKLVFGGIFNKIGLS